MGNSSPMTVFENACLSSVASVPILLARISQYLPIRALYLTNYPPLSRNSHGAPARFACTLIPSICSRALATDYRLSRFLSQKTIG